MSSGGKGGRGNKNSRLGGDKQNSSTSHKDTNDSRSESLSTEKDKESLPHKIAPTAEQLRLAQMIGNTKTEPDKVFQEKLNKVMQFTGVSSDEALVALHDTDNNVNTAIDNLLEGDIQGQWLASTKKKKKNPSNKAVEAENNKENRKVDNRERSGSRQRGGGAPRFRGRGGNRSGKDGDGDGPGRGEGSRRGRMSNGGPPSRGRGGRGRGGGSGPRTFQNRQPPGFPDSIDTWGPPESQDQQNSLKIDTWDEEPVPTNEDWEDEWTGSLDQTTVFGPSTTGQSAPEDRVPDQLLNAAGAAGRNISVSAAPTYPSANQPVSMAQTGHMELVALLQRAAPNSTLTGLGTATGPGLSNTGNVGGLTDDSVGGLGNGSTVGTLGNGTGVGGLGTAGGMGPLGNSTGVGSLGGIGSSNGVGGLCNSTLGGSANAGMGSTGQHSILNSLGNSMGEALKSGGLVNAVGGSGSVTSTSVAPYAPPNAPMQNSIFSNTGLHNAASSLSNSINSSTNSVVMNKSVTMPGQQSVPALANRQKAQRSRITHSSKIPSSAVEMPEDAMATLDMQFSGLEFGAETFDINSEIKVSRTNNANNGTMQQQNPVPASSHAHSVGHSVTPSVTAKDLSSVTSLPPSMAPTSKMSSYSSSQSSGSSGYNSSSVAGSNSNSTSNNANVSSTQNSANSVYGSGYSSQVSTGTASNQYQNSYVNSSSHSSLASMSTPKTLSGLKDASQSYSEPTSVGNAGLSSSLATSVSGSNTNVGSSSGANSGLSTALNTAPHHTQTSSKTLPAKAANVNSLGTNAQSSVQAHQATHIQTHQHQHQHQQHQQQQQAAQQLMAQPSQYVSPPAALQGSLPHTFYNVQQPMYSYEDLQLLHQRMPMQAPTTLTTGREGNIPSAAYTMADNKFRTDQNSSPVPSSINQPGATAGGTYITATGNAAIPPFYMYHNVAAVQSSFPQYGAPTIIQLPPNTHTASNNTQFPGATKLPYSTNYYDSVTQNPDFKSGYTASQGQNKAGGGSTGSATNSANDLASYKNHLSKTYEKQNFHPATPPPFNMGGSGTNPMTNYTPMFIPTIQTAQHHSPLMHHQLHQDGSTSTGQRTGNTTGQNKGGSKGYAPSYWSSS